MLDRLGCRPIPLDRTGGQNPFAVGGYYASCPRCDAFAAILIDSDGLGWRANCECWPRRHLDELDLLLEVRRAA